MKNIKRYSTVAEYNADQNRGVPCVSYINQNGSVIYDVPYEKQYLTFVALEDGTFNFPLNDVQYSTDLGSTWASLPKGTNTPTISTGNKILLKSVSWEVNPNSFGSRVSSTGQFNAEGNITSLQSFNEALAQSNFICFFKNSKIVSAEHLILPSTTLAQSCYAQMFMGCTNLTTAPELPATTLAESCYSTMFHSCSGLTKAPSVLPATTVPNYAYAGILGNNGMFHGCSSLTTAPVILATTLGDYSCQQMFKNCSSLNSITCLATDISAASCTSNWLTGVAATGTFTKAASMENWTTGASGIPDGWTVQDYTS